MMALPIPYGCDSCCCRSSSSSSGGGGSGGFARQVYEDHGEPNSIGFLPDNLTIANNYWDLDTNIAYVWKVNLQAWE